MSNELGELVGDMVTAIILFLGAVVVGILLRMLIYGLCSIIEYRRSRVRTSSTRNLPVHREIEAATPSPPVVMRQGFDQPLPLYQAMNPQPQDFQDMEGTIRTMREAQQMYSTMLADMERYLRIRREEDDDFTYVE